MKKTCMLMALLGLTIGLMAQETDSIATQTNESGFKQALNTVADAVVKWDTETMIDSLDQEKLPKMVTGGLFAGANMNDFLITRDHHTMSSHRRVGAEIGGFLDFRISKHFSVQPQVIFTFHQNYFADTVQNNRLWSFGFEIPVYFLGRFGNMKQGYVQFGGGIFTHFTFASNKGYNSYEKEHPIDPNKPQYEEDGFDYSRLYSMHNNHFGICFLVGYECTFGMQISAQYKISLSDVAGFYDEMKGQEIADALIYPHSISLCIGYRFK